MRTDAWWALHRELHRLLGGKPWEWPIAVPPDSTEFDATEANKLWLELQQTSAEAA